MSIAFSNKGKSNLLIGVDDSETQFIIDSSDYSEFLESSSDGDYIYAVLLDASGNMEIVRIDLATSGPHTETGNNFYSNGLTVARGRGGTAATEWPRGTLIYQDVTRSFLNDSVQKAGHRTVTYNPNGVLSPAYFGEKVYRSDVSGWWKSTHAVNSTWVLIGGLLVSPIAQGNLYGFGWNDEGQVGVGSTDLVLTPVQIGSDATWVQAQGGTEWSMGLKADGTLWSWGVNDDGNGNLGQGTIGAVSLSTPVQIGSGTTWSDFDVMSYGYTVIALQTDNTLWSWGKDTSYGLLGHGVITTSLSTPVQIGSDSTWSEVAMGITSAYAIKANGTLWAWGANGYGQLGQGNVVHLSTPVQVGSATDWSDVVAGQDCVLAINTDGKIYAWGHGSDGSLGQGADLAHKSTPVQVGSATDWSSIHSIWHSFLAINDSGELYSWGYCLEGELGLGDTNNKSTPVQVGSDTTWSSLGNQDYAVHGLKTDGTLWAWGFEDGVGELGITGVDVPISTPDQVGSGTGWQYAGGGDYHGFGII